MKTPFRLIQHLRLLYGFIFTLATFQPFAQQWVASPASAGLLPKGYSVMAVCAVDSAVVWAAASDFGDLRKPTPRVKLLRTTDGGKSWMVNTLADSFGRYCVDLQAFDDSTAWITSMGFPNALYKTTNGGKTWAKKFASSADRAYARFFDKMNGVCVETPGFAYATTDGGDHWTTDSAALKSAGLFSALTGGTNIFVRQGDTAWLGAVQGGILRTVDRGRGGWHVFSAGLDCAGAIGSIAFQDARRGMLVSTDRSGAFSRFYQTSDGGEHWQDVAAFPKDLLPYISNIVCIPGTAHFIAGLAANAFTPATGRYSADGGASWSTIKKDILHHGAVSFVSPTVGWMGTAEVGLETGDAVLYRWEAVSSATPVADPVDPAALTVSPNPTTGKFTLRMNDVNVVAPAIVRVMDLSGRMVFEQKNLGVGLREIAINLVMVPDGVYVAQLISADGMRARKIVIAK